MNPQDFKKLMDQVHENYCQMYDIIYSLKKEKQDLQEELNKQKAIAASLSQRLQTVPTISKKIIKMGSNWQIEGDNIRPIFLYKKFKFACDICNVAISKEGQIAFSCNKKIFLYQNNILYTVDESIKIYDPSIFLGDLSSSHRCVFAFDEESLVVYYRSSIHKFSNNKRIWSISVPNAYQIVASGGLLYVGTREYKILVLKETEIIKTYEYKDNVQSFSVDMGNICVFSDHRIGLLNKNSYVNEAQRILSMDISNGNIIYGGDDYLKICKASNSLETMENIAMKKGIILIKIWNSHVLVSTQDKSFTIWDLPQRKSMKVVMSENIVDISANEDKICTVDCNGGLNIWKLESH
jgi:hypothetical protein